jgi:hypothetical protein
MSEPTTTTGQTEAGKAEEFTALFAHLVMQQTNMAMMLMGKTPHPEAGQIPKDLEAARLFIDQLEMLEAKTQGNLTKQESGMLKQALMSLRMAFVEAVETPAQDVKKAAEPSAGPTADASQGSASEPKMNIEPGGESVEDKKKFTKKY